MANSVCQWKGARDTKSDSGKEGLLITYQAKAPTITIVSNIHSPHDPRLLLCFFDAFSFLARNLSVRLSSLRSFFVNCRIVSFCFTSVSILYTFFKPRSNNPPHLQCSKFKRHHTSTLAEKEKVKIGNIIICKTGVSPTPRRGMVGILYP